MNDGGLINLETLENPNPGNFRIVVYEDTDFTPSFAQGTTASFDPALIRAEITFNANALDPDCPVASVADLGPTASSQQSVASHLLFQQASTTISGGVGNAIAERFFGGGGAQLDASADGSALSGYVSMRGIEQAAERYQRRRLAHNATGPNQALDAIEQSFLDASREQAEGSDQLNTLHPLSYTDETGVALAEDPDAYRLNVWFRGTFTHFDGDSFSGNTLNGVSGIDYLISDTVLVGVIGGYESGDFTFAATNGAFDGAGLTAGAYVGVQLSQHIVADAFLTHSWLDYENRVGTASGTTDASRWLFSFNASGQYQLAQGFFLEPNVRFFYAHERQDAYLLSDGTAIASNNVESGRLSLGPRLRYAFEDGMSNTWSTFISAHGEYDMSSESQTNSALPDLDDLLSARLGLGIDGLLSNGWSISLAGDLGGLGSGSLTSYTGTAKLTIPLN